MPPELPPMRASASIPLLGFGILASSIRPAVCLLIPDVEPS